MNTSHLFRILEDEKAWLAELPSMQPWDEGCRRRVSLLEECLQRYSATVRERAAEADDVCIWPVSGSASGITGAMDWD